jgi:hypothetical protein
VPEPTTPPPLYFSGTPKTAPVPYTGFITDEQMMELAYGITVVELRCKKCGDLKAVQYAGNVGDAEARR